LSPKYGIAITETNCTKIRARSNGLYLLRYFISLSMKYIPMHEPIMQNVPSQSEYEIFSSPLNRYETVVAPDANIIMYMPDDVATFGGTPRLISKGLNIIPPPNPKAPDIHPPIKENTISFTKVSFVNSISFLFPLLNLAFNFYSYFICIKE
jgi:hypothetical protein